MNKKTTEKSEVINKDAVVGSGRVRIFNLDVPPPPPTKKAGSIKASIKPSVKRIARGCSGCSRKRKRG